MNTRSFDTLSAVLFLALYAHFVFSDNRQHVAQRIAVGVSMTIFTLLCLELLKPLLDIQRNSPSLMLEPVTRVFNLITSIKVKDSSTSSFPSDHAVVVFMVTTFIWRHAGNKYGIVSLFLSIVFLMPRLISGGHWLTDDLVGSGTIALIGMGWLLATPLHDTVVSKLLPVVTGVMNSLGLRSSETSGSDQWTNHIGLFPKTLAKGFCMGSADIIPGVSGGTMALILGIYERLLETIQSFDKQWLQQVLRLDIKPALARNDFPFLIPLVLGILAALVFFTRVVPLPTLIVTHPELIYGLFFGLILASILILMGEVDNWALPDVFIVGLGTICGFAIVNLVPVSTPNATWFIFLSGTIAISAMLLPGISGSFILLILGKYAYIVAALGKLKFGIILPFALGCLTGVILFSRVVVWLLHHYHKRTLLIIKGILIGSLWMIWPFQERTYELIREKQRLITATPVWPDTLDGTVMISAGMMLAGFLVVMAIHRLSSGTRSSE